MEKVINLYKPIGLTPLQAIDRFREGNRRYKSQKMSYAGRLDPMAQGVLLLLVGEENKKMRQYLGFDKEYKAKILLGFSSDTYDILGLVDDVSDSRGDASDDGEEIKELDESEIKKTIKEFKGNYKQKLPAYSSYRVKGKSLFYYARKGKLDEIKIPEGEVVIKKVKVDSIYKIGSGKLLKEIKEKVGKVDGDFRQKEILKKWESLLKGKSGEDEKYVVVEVVIGCSSGTYIRAIANDFGKRLGVNSLLLNLIRTKVGKFEVGKSVRLKKMLN